MKPNLETELSDITLGHIYMLSYDMTLEEVQNLINAAKSNKAVGVEGVLMSM